MLSCVHAGYKAVLCTDCSQACGAETSPEWKRQNRGEEEEEKEVPLFRRGTEKERARQGEEIMLSHALLLVMIPLFHHLIHHILLWFVYFRSKAPNQRRKNERSMQL